VGNKGLPPPPDFDTGMRADTPSVVFAFFKCLNPQNCDFSQLSEELRDTFLARNKRALGPIVDLCSVHNDCQSCIDDPENKCGWCSTNVLYNGTILGKQCAGHNEDGSKLPFVCNGQYSTETCHFPTTMTTSTSSTGSTGSTGSTSDTTSTSTTGGGVKKYECNPTNATCEEGTTGSFNSKVDCEPQCQKNPIPTDLVGNWRGLQINKNYLVGEWKAVFSPSNVTVIYPDGDRFSGSVSLVGKYLIINPINGPLSGKKITSLTQILFGPETKFLTWAWGAPGGNPSDGFESSMTEPNNAEYVFSACLPGKETKICNFDH